MSYVEILEYEIIPKETYKIIRGCAGCGGKQTFISKEHFRVNANGNRLDVWMIYGCETCGHTYNLPVYERISPVRLSEQEYSRFLSNDSELLFQIGMDKSIFIRNKAEIARDQMRYEIVPVVKKEWNLENGSVSIRLHNTYEIPVRIDKVVAEILQVPRSVAKKLITIGTVSVKMER